MKFVSVQIGHFGVCEKTLVYILYNINNLDSCCKVCFKFYHFCYVLVLLQTQFSNRLRLKVKGCKNSRLSEKLGILMKNGMYQGQCMNHSYVNKRTDFSYS